MISMKEAQRYCQTSPCWPCAFHWIYKWQGCPLHLNSPLEGPSSLLPKCYWTCRQSWRKAAPQMERDTAELRNKIWRKKSYYGAHKKDTGRRSFLDWKYKSGQRAHAIHHTDLTFFPTAMTCTQQVEYMQVRQAALPYCGVFTAQNTLKN